MTVPSALVDAADSALELTVIGSFTRIGYDVRSRIRDWSDEPVDLSGQVAIVTGSTSGIGRATAQGLLDLGADVAVTSRSIERAVEAADELNRSDAAGTARGFALDTADFASIHDFVDRLGSFAPSVDMVAHNAGALTDEYRTDGRGMELTLSSHLVGPYLLTKLLEPRLSNGARVVYMSSGGMYTQGLEVDRIEMSPRNYRGTIAYARAKRGQVEMVTHLGPQLAPAVKLHSMHPGWVDTPGVEAGLPGFGKVMGPLLRDADQGADTMVWLCATGAPGSAAGQFWLDRRPRRTAYLPGTGATPAERQRLVDWLDAQIAPALAESAS